MALSKVSCQKPSRFRNRKDEGELRLLRTWLVLLAGALATFGLGLALVVRLRGELNLLALDRQSSVILLQLIGAMVLAIAVVCLFLDAG